jgi:hypothetical protein
MLTHLEVIQMPVTILFQSPIGMLFFLGVLNRSNLTARHLPRIFNNRQDFYPGWTSIMARDTTGRKLHHSRHQTTQRLDNPNHHEPTANGDGTSQIPTAVNGVINVHSNLKHKQQVSDLNNDTITHHIAKLSESVMCLTRWNVREPENTEYYW